MQTIKVPLGKIEYSPTNPRKTFDEVKLRELGESIKAVGLINPPRVRSLGKNGFELIVGERRVRGAQMAGLHEIDVIVEDLTDEQVIEAQIVENAQRVDVHPIEEADAFLQLQRDHGYSIERLVEKTGKSKAHLYGRLKLATTLIPDAKKACLEGKIIASVAELIARLDQKLQPDALDIALGCPERPKGAPYNYQSPIEQLGIRAESEDMNGLVRSPLSFRSFQKIYHAKFATRLDEAPFDTTDDHLLESMGACTGCEHNSSNTRELFPDLQKPAGVCTNTECFTAKCEVTYQIRLVAAESRGLKVLDEKANEKLHAAKEGKGDYVDPSEVVPYDLLRPEQRNASKRPTWEKLLGKKHEVPTVLAKDERGGPVELLDKKKLIEHLRETKKIDKPEKPASSPAAKKATPEQLEKEKEKAEKNHAKLLVREAAFDRTLGDLAEKVGVMDAGSRKLQAVVRWFAVKLLDMYIDEVEIVAARRLLDRKTKKNDAAEALAEIIESSDMFEVIALLVELEAAGSRRAVTDPAYAWEKNRKADFEELAELVGVDFEKQLELATKAEAAEKKSDDAKAKKKGGK